MLTDFLIKYGSVITIVFELIAALSGSYYLRKVENSLLRVFVYYLWLTFIVEIAGTYTYLMEYDFDYEWFQAIKNSVFSMNIWLYNIYAYLGIGFISVFYYDLMTSFKTRITVLITLGVFSLFSILYFTLTDAFFIAALPYHFFISVSIICLYVLLYFLQLINSDKILDFYKLPSFYISITLLLLYLCIIPLFIFDGYFQSINADFVRFRIVLLLFINICTYSSYTFAFLYTLYRNRR